MDQMGKQETLARIFRLLRAGEVPEARILELLQHLKPGDVAWIMEYVERLQGPQGYLENRDEYDDADNAKSEIIVLGFFKFIDLVSALIIKLGDEAVEEAKRFENSSSHYVPWVLRYCTDQRFKNGISESFPFLEI